MDPTGAEASGGGPGAGGGGGLGPSGLSGSVAEVAGGAAAAIVAEATVGRAEPVAWLLEIWDADEERWDKELWFEHPGDVGPHDRVTPLYAAQEDKP